MAATQERELNSRPVAEIVRDKARHAAEIANNRIQEIEEEIGTLATERDELQRLLVSIVNDFDGRPQASPDARAVKSEA